MVCQWFLLLTPLVLQGSIGTTHNTVKLRHRGRQVLNLPPIHFPSKCSFKLLPTHSVYTGIPCIPQIENTTINQHWWSQTPLCRHLSVCVCLFDQEYPRAVNQAEGLKSQPSESPNLITQIYWDMILWHQVSSQIFKRIIVPSYSCYHHTPLDSNL